MPGDIYQRNLNALKERKPILYKRLLSVGDDFYTEILDSLSGVPTLKVNGIFFHSAYDPLDEMKYLLEEVSLKDAEGVIILGMGLGYHIRKIWSDPFFKGKILIVENDLRIFKRALEVSDFTNIINDPSVFIIVEEEASSAVKEMEKSGFFVLNMVGIEMVLHPPSINTSLKYYLEVLRDLRGLMSYYKSSFSTMEAFQNIWQKNSMDNLVDVASLPGVKQLEGVFHGKGIPAVIVCAGPSLDDALEYIKLIKGRVPIFSVGTAFGALMKAGVKPDFIVVVDAADVVLEQFKGKDTDGIYLFAADFVHPDVINMFKPNLFFYTCPENPFNVLLPLSSRDKGKIFAGGSVSHAAADIAVKMGFNPLILIGQDLSYASDRRTYAGGTMYEGRKVTFSNEEEFRKKGLMWVKGNYEDRVLTYVAFYVFLTSWERYIREHPEVEFINATSAGAFIKGTKVVKPEDALRPYMNADSILSVRGILEDKLDDFVFDLEGFRSSLKEALPHLYDIRRDLEEGYEKALQLKELINEPERDRRSLHEIACKLDRLSQRLDENPYSRLLKFGGGYYRFLTLDMELKTAAMKIEAQKKMCASVHEVYKEFLDSAVFITERIEKLLDRWSDIEKIILECDGKSSGIV